jgi:hypothetical protein
VLCCRRNKVLDIFDLERNTRLYSIKTDFPYGVRAIALTPHGGRVVVSRRHLSCWDLASGECLATFIPERPITACRLSSNSRIVIGPDAPARSIA